MSPIVAAYQHGIHPRSEDVVATTRAFDRGRVSADEVEDAFKADREDFIATQEGAGLDYFSDGLLRWQDIFRPLVEATPGLSARTLVRWFDNNAFFRAPEAAESLGRLTEAPPELDDGLHLPHPRMATLPSPYLFSRAAHVEGDRNAWMVELTEQVLRPLAETLLDREYALVHLQEPWASFFGMDTDAWTSFERAIGSLREATEDRAALVLHTYFGDAAPLADRLRTLPVDAVGVDFVETDLDALGSGWQTGVLAGCLDGRRSPIESVDGTVAFAERVAEQLDPPVLYLSSNCELEFLPRDIARQKVLRLGEVSAAAKKRLS